jgi:hypothetical protein
MEKIFQTKKLIFIIHYPTSTRRHGNFAGVHTLLRILLSSNSAVLINIITILLLLMVIQCKQRCTRTTLPCNVTVVDLK